MPRRAPGPRHWASFRRAVCTYEGLSDYLLSYHARMLFYFFFSFPFAFHLLLRKEFRRLAIRGTSYRRREERHHGMDTTRKFEEGAHQQEAAQVSTATAAVIDRSRQEEGSRGKEGWVRLRGLVVVVACDGESVGGVGSAVYVLCISVKKISQEVPRLHRWISRLTNCFVHPR